MTRQGPEVKSESSVNPESKRANPPNDSSSHGVGGRLPHLILALLLAWIGCGSTFALGNNGASASDFSVLHAFSEVPYFSVGNEDGAQPKAGLVVAENALFGTTIRGGAKGNGTLFKVGMDGRGFTVLHHFIYADGLQIERALVWSGSMLYGAASQGGTGKGTVFACSKDGATFKVLHAFNGSDGSSPDSLLLLDGHLYGNAVLGGTYSNGTLYRMDLDGSNFQVLHHFKDLADGMRPSGTLVQMDGILFGTTRGGIARGYSTVFRFDPTSAQLSAIYHFGSSEESESGLAVSRGMLLGTLSNPNAGTVFKLGSDGSGFKILHKFDRDADGSSPSLLTASAAMLFGTASSGGPGHHGTIYGVKDDGTAFKTLYSFPLPNMNSEGSMPLGSVAISGSKLYGTTFGAGASGQGVVFSLSIEPAQSAPNDKPVTGPDPVISDRVTRLDATTGSAGSAVTIPITFVAKGDENSLGFSLAFPSNQASFGGLTLGAGANGASLVLNTNQAASTPARVGVVLFWPVNQTIAPGAQPLAILTLQLAAGLPVGTVIPVQFTNSPALKSASDILGNDVAVTFTDGTITVAAAGYEGDVAPRPNGNGVINAGDLTVLGRIVAGLDSAPTGAELQRADCAPRSTLGNGIINAGDLTQLARYVAGLDPQTPTGGLTAPANGVASAPGNPGAVARKNTSPRRVSLVQARDNTPASATALIQAVAQGNENALSFSIAFDTASLTYTDATLGAGGTGASLVLNTNRVAFGQLGVVLSLPANQSLLSGTFDLLRVRFAAATSAATSAVKFSNTPAPNSVSDILGNDLIVEFVDGTLQTGITPLPVIRDIRVSDATLSATLTCFAPGATVTLQTSPNLREWTDAQTFTSINGSISVQRPVQPNAVEHYLRFFVR